ncbi:MAG: formylmethanofuran--tetrahydromethanopterin N-formyltransferase [Candidatus Heimdallarchaeota archaeon]|nr:formylmethanofuran--tetrahydromethanopterin N-formyltransferase [Candidatus Heimdallarchaeota archaeon]
MVPPIIDDTYSECFTMWYSRILITAIDEEMALIAAQETIGFATSIIMCSAEAGIERLVSAKETPDNRPGVVIQIWTRHSKQMKDELLSRLSQCAMTTPTTNIFNFTSVAEKSVPVGKLIAYFGDGFQKKITKFGHELWEIPVMDGSFLIEDSFNIAKGIAGGLLILLGTEQVATLQAAKTAVKAIRDSKAQAITSFPGGICRSGSKIGSKYSFLNESTNHRFCPGLKKDVSDSLLPPEVQCAYEIVINAVNEDELKKALKAGIDALRENNAIVKITSSNFGGELGKITINLKDLTDDSK